jgi:hypothetical protein
MDQRDWELLDEQMRGFSRPRNNGVMGFTITVVFLAGLAIGGILSNQRVPVQFAGNNAKVATYFAHGSAPITAR